MNFPHQQEFELTSISGDEGGSSVKVGLFPATFVQGNVNCEVKTVSEGRFSCQLETSSGQSEIPSKERPDAELDVGNQYVWSSNRYLVYIEGNISGSFSDMGFVDGWNIATVNGSEILHVKDYLKIMNLYSSRRNPLRLGMLFLLLEVVLKQTMLLHWIMKVNIQSHWLH